MTYKTQLTGIIGITMSLFLISVVGSTAIPYLFGIDTINASVVWTSRILIWAALAVLWCYAARIEHQPLLLWKDRRLSFLEYAGSVMGILFALIIITVILGLVVKMMGVNTMSEKIKALLAIFRNDKILLVFTALTAGVVEEFVVRGYMQPRLELLFKSPAAAIFVSSVVFGVLHIGYGTLINVLAPFLIGLVLAGYYSKFRNIKVLIFCHFFWDFALLWLQAGR